MTIYMLMVLFRKGTEARGMAREEREALARHKVSDRNYSHRKEKRTTQPNAQQRLKGLSDSPTLCGTYPA